MYQYSEHKEAPYFHSPLELLYTAYSDEHPLVSPVMEKGFQKLDDLLSTLTEQERNTVLQTFYEIYTENEAFAFQSGVRTGVCLAKELI